MSRALSLVGMVLALMSTANLMIEPQLRDYAKGPFLLAVMLIMGLLVVGPAGRRRAIALSAPAGAVIGLGLGFRTDLMVAVLPPLLTVALLMPAKVAVRTRVLAIAAFPASLAEIRHH